MRIGIGYDVHAFAKNRPLIIGGVTIPHHQGLLGHSDADVLTHTIMDAMLGALAMGSIGHFFPDTDSKYKDADSLVLLKVVDEAIQQAGYKIGNIDSVIAAQAPKLNPYLPEMQKALAKVLNIETGQIGIKATTTEKLGFVGKEEGIAAHAVVLLLPR